jgi:hypothetical protein
MSCSCKEPSVWWSFNLLILTLKMPEIIYVKTDKGREEVESHAHGLRPKARRVLIMVDAHRTAADLSKAAGIGDKDKTKDLLKLLFEGGFIVSRDALVKQTAEASTAPLMTSPKPQRIEYPPEDIEKVKKIILETSDEYLGLLGADIKRRVETVNDSSAIISCIARWNLAMRESKLAKPVAAYYLQQIQTILG